MAKTAVISLATQTRTTVSHARFCCPLYFELCQVKIDIHCSNCSRYNHLVSRGQTLPGRKGLVKCRICIAQSAHRQLTKYLPTATVFDHSFHHFGVQGAKLFTAVPIITTATYHTPNYLCGVASYPGSCVGGEKRAWYRPFAHALNYKLKNHVYVANDV